MKRMMQRQKLYQKNMTWVLVKNTLQLHGWFLERDEKYRKSFERGEQRIIVFGTALGKWKTEYFEDDKLMDSAGINDERFSKLMAMEMGVMR